MRNPARQAPPRRLAPYKKRSRMESLGEAGRSLARSRSISMVSSAFLLFVFVYIVRFVLAFATKEAVKVEKVVYATMDAPVTVSGLIIRDESVYQSPAEGTVKFLVANHARVKKGSVVCTVENTVEIEKAQPDLDKIDQELLKMQEERDFVAYSAEQENINEQIKIRVDSQIMSFAKGDLAIAYSLKDSVSQSVDARNRLALS
ncbi:MAG: hypothetical protein LBC41_14090, partial [Clostridiales bacterium]|nr:hypothetical protein [Clostridiales bacterium]